MAMPVGFAGPVIQRSTTGTDWVAIARWITIGYGALSALTLILVGLLLQHINVPITDPNTGITTVQTFNIGPAFAIAAVLVAGIFALFAWLTQYTVARVIFLVLDVLAVFGAVSQLGNNAQAGGFGILGFASLGIDFVYGAALLMSLVSSRPQPVYG